MLVIVMDGGRVIGFTLCLQWIRDFLGWANVLYYINERVGNGNGYILSILHKH
jgi:hypothetical protein